MGLDAKGSAKERAKLTSCKRLLDQPPCCPFCSCRQHSPARGGKPRQGQLSCLMARVCSPGAGIAAATSCWPNWATGATWCWARTAPTRACRTCCGTTPPAPSTPMGRCSPSPSPGRYAAALRTKASAPPRAQTGTESLQQALSHPKCTQSPLLAHTSQVCKKAREKDVCREQGGEGCAWTLRHLPGHIKDGVSLGATS